MILEGEDYRNRTELIRTFEREVDDNQKQGGVVISGGMDIYRSETDHSYVFASIGMLSIVVHLINDVFRRADRKMYERKKKLNAMEE